MSDSNNGRQNSGGAPVGNTNAFRHGLRSARLPKECRYIEYAVNQFRRQIETAIVDEHGATTVYQAALTHSAIRHERRAMLGERWLRLNADMPLADRLGLLKTISDATDARDKCLERLGLDKAADFDPWSGLDAPRIAHMDAAQPPQCDDAAGDGSQHVPAGDTADGDSRDAGGEQ